MFGAVIGDYVGSRYEWYNHKSKDFEFFNKNCRFTDDSMMTLAVASALLECKGNYDELSDKVIKSMQEIGRRYPDCGFGGKFFEWIMTDNPKPYNSWGNGSAMRVSFCGWIGKSIDEVKKLSYEVSKVSHNHPEGLKGAEAVAVAIYLAKSGEPKNGIKDYIEKNYYKFDFTLDEIRSDYEFDVSCQGSVPEALEAFFESNDFEDAIRNAISIGGDSDTIGAITGSMADAYYYRPNIIVEKDGWKLSNPYDFEIINRMDEYLKNKSYSILNGYLE